MLRLYSSTTLFSPGTPEPVGGVLPGYPIALEVDFAVEMAS
jgi:hypothetical protein